MCRAHPGGGVDSAKGFGGFGGLPHPGHPAAASLPVAVSKNSCTCVLAGVNLHHWPSGGTGVPLSAEKSPSLGQRVQVLAGHSHKQETRVREGAVLVHMCPHIYTECVHMCAHAWVCLGMM